MRFGLKGETASPRHQESQQNQSLGDGWRNAGRSKRHFGLAALLLAAAGAVQAGEPIADQTCVMFDAGLVCASVFEADLLMDSQPAALTEPAGQGFARVGYLDSTTGEFKPVIEIHYTDRFLTSYPYPRTLLLVPNDEWISSGGFEGEYAMPLR